MTHEEINAAIRMSLLVDDARETHRAVYARRRKTAPAPDLPAPSHPSIHHSIAPDFRDDTGFAEGARW